jgi:hypothetical protein
MSPSPSENDPLITRTRSRASNGELEVLPKRIQVQSRRLGPLEISRTTRYGILAGMWSANFLAVCYALLTWCFPATYRYIFPEGLKSYCLLFVSTALKLNDYISRRISCSNQYVRCFLLASTSCEMTRVVLPQISSEFRQFNQAGWLGTSCVVCLSALYTLLIWRNCTRYLLSACTFTPLYGRLCNVLGRKGASQVALLFACLGVLMSGLSNSMEMLIASRFVRCCTARN